MSVNIPAPFPLIPLLRREATITSGRKNITRTTFPLIPLLRREATTQHRLFFNFPFPFLFPLIPLLRREATAEVPKEHL